MRRAAGEHVGIGIGLTMAVLFWRDDASHDAQTDALFAEQARIGPAATGVLLSLGFLLLVYWLAAAAAGPERYAAARDTLASPLAQLVWFGAAFAFCYHLLNGVRHLFFDMGRGFELKTARASGRAVQDRGHPRDR